MSALTRSKEGLGSAFSAFSPVGTSGVRPRYAVRSVLSGRYQPPDSRASPPRPPPGVPAGQLRAGRRPGAALDVARGGASRGPGGSDSFWRRRAALCGLGALVAGAVRQRPGLPPHAGVQQRALRRRLRGAGRVTSDFPQIRRQGQGAGQPAAGAGARPGDAPRLRPCRPGRAPGVGPARGWREQRVPQVPCPLATPCPPPLTRPPCASQAGKVSNGKSTYRGVRQRPWGKVRTRRRQAWRLSWRRRQSAPLPQCPPIRPSLQPSLQPACLAACLSPVCGGDPGPNARGPRVAGHL